MGNTGTCTGSTGTSTGTDSTGTSTDRTGSSDGPIVLFFVLLCPLLSDPLHFCPIVSVCCFSMCIEWSEILELCVAQVV